ncbi:SDR family NAD(P)-dependent oxidoreductase [Arthrobacter sp. A5]|uniref:SDR family NAD(P)-dependent oxidoreductase n=1 Tax=Arthrobacter sp. A5 TaxID=576926 RepID=UPI003DA963B1
MNGLEEPRRQRTVLIAGGSSPAGIAAARVLTGAGMRVLSVGSDASRISAAVAGMTGATGLVCDLADASEVAALAGRIHAEHGPVDGLVHLVGGWRGGKGLAAQSDADWDFLHRSVLTTLRNTTRAFYPDLAASPVGRLAIVSSTSVTAPTAGNANYAAIKAAAEAWTLAVADAFATDASQGAAVVLVVKALVDDAMRAAAPQRSFPGFTDVSLLAQEFLALFSHPAAGLNGRRKIL